MGLPQPREVVRNQLICACLVELPVSRTLATRYTDPVKD